MTTNSVHIMNMTLFYQDPGRGSNRIKELLESALEEFKKANPDKAKQLANIRVIADEDNIVIQMPSSKLFNSFIKQLMHDNLLPRLQIPKTNIERQNKSDSMDDEVSRVMSVKCCKF